VPKALAVPCPCRARRHNWLEIMAKVDRPCEFRPPGMRSAPIMQRPGQASSHCSSTNHFRSLSEHRLVRIADHAALAALLPRKWKLAQTRLATCRQLRPSPDGYPAPHFAWLQ
jgi:hypothetical protein